MSFEIIVNKETGETIEYKQQIFVDYNTLVLQREDNSKYSALQILENEIFINVLKEEKPVESYLIEDMLLFVFDNENNYYRFDSLPNIAIKEILKKNSIKVIVKNEKNEFKFSVNFEDIIIV